MKSIAHENRQKALLHLVSKLSETVATPIEVVPFCLKYKIDSSFFEALRDLDCLTLLPVGTDEVMRFTPTAKLLSITVDEVLSMEKKLKKAVPRPGKVKSGTLPEAVSEANIAPELGLPDTGKGTNPATEAIRRIIEEGPLPKPSLAEIMATPFSKAADQCDETRPVLPGIELWQHDTSALAPDELAEPKVDLDQAYLDLMTSLGVKSRRTIPHTAEPKPYPNLSATVPMLDSHAEAAAYCADVIFAHADNEPHDQTGLLASVGHQLKNRQLLRAQELRDEAAAILSRAEAFERAAEVTY